MAYNDDEGRCSRGVPAALIRPTLRSGLATNQLIHRSEDMSKAAKAGIDTRKPFSERGAAHAAWRLHLAEHGLPQASLDR